MINVQSGEMDTDKQSVFVCFKMIAPKSIFFGPESIKFPFLAPDRASLTGYI